MQSETLSAQSSHGAAPVEALAHTRQLPVLGIPVSYESDTPEVLDVVADALGAWRSMDRVPWLVETRGVHVRIVVDDDGGTMWTGSGSDTTTVDDERRPRVAWVRARRALLEDPRQFWHGPVEAVTLAMLERLDRAPVNAAAVGRDGTALLLVGLPGAGKSTLAYAASRAGLNVLADERVYVQTRPELRVWGLPGSLHLPLDAVAHFSELARLGPVRLANGTSRLVVNVERRGALPEVPLARRVGVCLLRREGSAGSEFARVHPDRIMMELGETSAGGDAYPDEMIALIGRLAERGAWVLNMAGPPSQLVPRLEAMLEAVVEQPAVAQQTAGI